MNKEEKRKYFLSFKQINPKIRYWLKILAERQKTILNSFNINYIRIKDYDLPFKKIDFINSISSFVYKGKLGKKLDKIVYYDKIPLAYIQYSSPILNSKLNDFLKEKYGKYDFTKLNKKVVELSICVPFGFLTKYLTGKLAVFCAISREIINEWDNFSNAKVEILFTTSIYGKSSMYNRVRNLKYLGLSKGYHSILTKEQLKEIKEKYKKAFPHRKIKITAQAEHIIRLYDHLLKKGIELSFTIPKLKRGIYMCDNFLSLKENIEYWYNRWFLPRRQRLPNTEKIKNLFLFD